jgi:hypothetical protein
MSAKKSIIFHHSNYNHFGGVETFCFNTIKALSPFYNITFLSKSFTASDVFELAKYCNIETYNPKSRYEADYCILATAWGDRPTNIKAGKVVQAVHADYEAYIEGWKFTYSKNPITTHHVAVSQHVAKMFEKVTEFKCDKVIYNLL